MIFCENYFEQFCLPCSVALHTVCTFFFWQFLNIFIWQERLFTLSGVCFNGQAFTEIAVYNISVFILASLNIKHSSDSDCASGNVICFSVCLADVYSFAWETMIISLSFLCPCKLGSYCQCVLFKLVVEDRQQTPIGDFLGTQSCIVKDGLRAGFCQSEGYRQIQLERRQKSNIARGGHRY